jgi:hypothetical protein
MYVLKKLVEMVWSIGAFGNEPRCCVKRRDFKK